MLVLRPEYKKEKGADEGWPLMARAIDNSLETLPRIDPAMGSPC